MQRQRVVDRAADPLGLEVRLQLVPPRHPDRVLVEDVLVGRVDGRRAHVGVSGERLGVAARALGPGAAPSLEMRQLGQQHRGLERVEAAVVADLVVMILPGAAMQPEPAQPLGQLVVLRDHHPAVAEPAEVLAGEEREGADGAELARAAPLAVHLPARADRLGGVLDQGEPMAPRPGAAIASMARHLPEQVRPRRCPGCAA